MVLHLSVLCAPESNATPTWTIWARVPGTPLGTVDSLRSVRSTVEYVWIVGGTQGVGGASHIENTESEHVVLVKRLFSSYTNVYTYSTYAVVQQHRHYGCPLMIRVRSGHSNFTVFICLYIFSYTFVQKSYINVHRRQLHKNWSTSVVFVQSDNGKKTLLDKFYSDPKRWAYTFESFTFMSRLNIEKERSKKATTVSCSINERSVYSSKYVWQ